MNDLRFACRQLLKNPGFTAVAVLTLALGIGATTAIFSVVYAVVLRPLPFPESERLVALWTQTPQVDRLPMAAANHRDLKSQNTVFEDIAILSRIANYNLTGDGEPERLVAARVPANLFPLLRVKPALGRGFTEAENQPGQDRVVILSHGLWQRRYAGDPDIFRTRSGFGHVCVARLKPGVTLEQAQTEVSVIATRLAQEYPEANKEVRFNVTLLRRDIAGVAQKPLIVLLCAALGLLLIGCCNLVNLLLARALTRNHETAVRFALGATPSRLIR